jgi:hypothetical protein
MKRLMGWIAVALVAFVLPLQERIHEKRLARIAQSITAYATAQHGPEVVGYVPVASLDAIIKRTEPEDDFKPRLASTWVPDAPRIAWSPGLDPPNSEGSAWSRHHPWGLALARAPPTTARVAFRRQHFFNASGLLDATRINNEQRNTASRCGGHCGAREGWTDYLRGNDDARASMVVQQRSTDGGPLLDSGRRPPGGNVRSYRQSGTQLTGLVRVTGRRTIGVLSAPWDSGDAVHGFV